MFIHQHFLVPAFHKTHFVVPAVMFVKCKRKSVKFFCSVVVMVDDIIFKVKDEYFIIHIKNWIINRLLEKSLRLASPSHRTEFPYVLHQHAALFPSDMFKDSSVNLLFLISIGVNTS